nr:MAG TPA: hypothetical protein [Caudoviricetes sp.]
MYVIYTCVYFGLVIYLSCQSEIYHYYELSRVKNELARFTEVCTYYTSVYRICQYFYFVFTR